MSKITEKEDNLMSTEMGRELSKMVAAWSDFAWEVIHSMATKKFLSSMVAGLGVSVVTWSIFWWVKNTAYAQNALGVSQISAPSLAVTWIMSGGALSVLVGFARTNYKIFKRCFDIMVSGFSLVVLSPLFLIIAILTKADSEGSIFFKQERLGHNKEIFKMWKFRTMRRNAELETGPVWAQDNDPRVTGIGQFLRKSHLDELPQLVNVFLGHMSLIGPRPERPEFSDEISQSIPNFSKRLDIRPGITGLAQTRYSYGASIRDAMIKLKYDSIYIKRMSWLLDFQIMFWTVGRVLTGEGAR